MVFRARLSLILASALLLGSAAAGCGDDDDDASDGDGGVSDGGGDGGPQPDADLATHPSGYDTRPINATCRAPARPPVVSGGEITMVPAFPNMDFVHASNGEGQAIGLIRSRMGASGPLRWFVVERDGDIWTFIDPNASKTGLAANGTTAVETAELFFDLPVNPYGIQGEGGMLGVAFDPDFGVRDDANYVYVHYTTYPMNNVYRYRVTRSGNSWTRSDELAVFRTGSGGGNHWGGDLKFGPDGFLYISLGDGGNGYPQADAQKLSWLRGKILRIDPRAQTTPDGYSIPTANPYRLSDPQNAGSTPNTTCGGLDMATLAARTTPCPEVFASGLRNPWRMNFDRMLGRLWLGDVGSMREEINLIVAGGNYGWMQCDGIFPTSSCPPANATSTHLAPIAQYRTETGSNSVAGGFVYRGTALGTALQGAYLFSDVYTGRLYVIDQPYQHVETTPFKIRNTFEHPTDQSTSNPTLPKYREIPLLAAPPLVAFAEDENAELYTIHFSAAVGQSVMKLVPPGGPTTDTIPMLLSQTGCADPADPKQPAAGMIPYELNAPFWSDGAQKTRWLALPASGRITVGADGDWDFPVNTVMRKDFRLGGKLIETRLLVRHADGGWAGYTWSWRDNETDAVKVSPAGEERLVGTQMWKYPARAGCMLCHTAGAGFSLGLETRQLNRNTSYPNGRRSNQIDTYQHIDLFTAAQPAGSTLPRFVDPFGSAPLATRARTYLHANCAQCHRGTMDPNMHFDTTLAMTGLCMSDRLVPGMPGTSQLWGIIQDPDPAVRMPRGGGNVIDQNGVRLLEDWIRAQASCP